MTAPLVSVIMAVRNGERFLSQAIESALAQDYRPIEVILIDGQSVDRTAEIARAYPDIHYIYQENRGIANAYNIGVTAAQGEFVAFLSHDDLWLPNKLSVQVNYLIAHPDIEYTVAATQFFLEPGCPFPVHVLRSDILEGNRVVRMMEILMTRRCVFERVGLFDPTLSTAEDIDWYARADDVGVPMAVIYQVLLQKRIHDANTSLFTTEHQQNIMRALRRSAERKRRLTQEEKL
ncbi:MAG: glycosyltransferase [Chloroflexi bacterium]|nr:glycosyltransferase [Chloroflexota bacterium]